MLQYHYLSPQCKNLSYRSFLYTNINKSISIALVNSKYFPTSKLICGLGQIRDPGAVRKYWHKEEYPPVSNWSGFE